MYLVFCLYQSILHELVGGGEPFTFIVHLPGWGRFNKCDVFEQEYVQISHFILFMPYGENILLTKIQPGYPLRIWSLFGKLYQLL